MSSGPGTSIAICIPTAERSANLDRLLASLGAIAVPVNTTARVIVVDNGETQAEVAREAELAKHSLPLRVIPESRRGIPFARNTAVSAGRDADFIVFVDDDEELGSDWLQQLLTTARKYSADVVAAPVLPRFPPGSSWWVRRSGLWDRRRLPTGTPIDWAATGNTLIRTRVFDLIEPWFESRFATTGGSDLEFFQRVARAGLTMVWCDEAVAHESLPPERLRVRWVVRRALRIGSVAGAELVAAHGRVSRPVARRAARSVAMLLASPLLLTVAARRGWRGFFGQIRRLLVSVGHLMGIFGRTVREYQTRPESASEEPAA